MESGARVSLVMEPVLPGRIAVLTVGGGSDSTELYAFRMEEGDAALVQAFDCFPRL